MRRLILSVILFPTLLQAQLPTLLPYRLGDKFGFSDSSGKIIIQPQWDAVSTISYDSSLFYECHADKKLHKTILDENGTVFFDNRNGNSNSWFIDSNYFYLLNGNVFTVKTHKGKTTREFNLDSSFHSIMVLKIQGQEYLFAWSDRTTQVYNFDGKKLLSKPNSAMKMEEIRHRDVHTKVTLLQKVADVFSKSSQHFAYPPGQFSYGVFAVRNKTHYKFYRLRKGQLEAVLPKDSFIGAGYTGEDFFVGITRIDSSQYSYTGEGKPYLARNIRYYGNFFTGDGQVLDTGYKCRNVMINLDKEMKVEEDYYLVPNRRKYIKDEKTGRRKIEKEAPVKADFITQDEENGIYTLRYEQVQNGSSHVQKKQLDYIFRAGTYYVCEDAEDHMGLVDSAGTLVLDFVYKDMIHNAPDLFAFSEYKQNAPNAPKTQAFALVFPCAGKVRQLSCRTVELRQAGKGLYLLNTGKLEYYIDKYGTEYYKALE